ncbi:MAG: 50S ribosomal protein L18 [Phycisphaerae bacterium]|jgi:large subunit ribosomal protein L18|nr:50S ribosomal protein L18 [Phycisphaerae bacterium]
MKAAKHKTLRRQRRKRRVRKRVTGTPGRPRLTVFRSHKNIYAQIVDDTLGQTLVAASSREKPLRDKGFGGNAAAAKAVGEALASKADQAGIQEVVFDRNGYPYHGRVKELAEAARASGLKF